MTTVNLLCRGNNKKELIKCTVYNHRNFPKYSFLTLTLNWSTINCTTFSSSCPSAADRTKTRNNNCTSSSIFKVNLVINPLNVFNAYKQQSLSKFFQHYYLFNYMCLQILSADRVMHFNVFLRHIFINKILILVLNSNHVYLSL